MSNDLANVHLPPGPDNSPMALIRLAIDKGISPDQMTALYNLAERHAANQAAMEFGKAIQAFQEECPPIVKSQDVRKAGQNGQPGALLYNFANLDDIMKVAGPIMARNKIAVTYDTSFASGLMSVTARVRVGSHVESTTVTLGLPGIPNANDSQKAGGALAYGQRYALKAALGIVVTGEDRDALEQFQGIDQEQTKELNELLEILRKKAEANKASPEKWEKWKADFWAIWGWKSMNDVHASKFADVKDRLQKAINK